MALLVIALVTVILCVAVRRTAGRPSGAAVRWWICVGLAAAAFGGVLFRHIYEVATRQWSLEDSLPLHICDMGVYLTGVALVLVARAGAAGDEMAGNPGRGRRLAQALYEVAYFWGLAGTTQALLTPDVEESFPSPVYFRYFINHGGIVVSVLVMTIGLRMRPRPGSWKWIWLLTLGLAAAVLAINGLIGANYMYLCEKPDNATVIDVLGRWPWYLLSLVGLGTLLIWLCYSPWWLIDRLSREKRQFGRTY